jgi:hypothetical protein
MVHKVFRIILSKEAGKISVIRDSKSNEVIIWRVALWKLGGHVKNYISDRVVILNMPVETRDSL